MTWKIGKKTQIKRDHCCRETKLVPVAQTCIPERHLPDAPCNPVASVDDEPIQTTFAYLVEAEQKRAVAIAHSEQYKYRFV